MADWFKFYENDIDETRLQYAISQLPEVFPVWVGILSEACRHKSDTVRWGANEIELFGFSRRLGISIPKVNEAVNLLVKIDYISQGGNALTIIKWHEKQSEYCQKRTKIQNQSGDNHHTKKKVVPTVSGECPDNVGQEERRGDESRKDNTANAAGEAFKKPTEVPVELQTAGFLAAWANWETHRKEKRQKMTPLASKMQLNKLKDMGEKRAIAAINFSIASGWTGIYEERVNNFKQTSNSSIDSGRIAPHTGGNY